MRKLYCYSMLIAVFLVTGCSQPSDDLGEPTPKGVASTRALQEELRDPIRESIARSFEMGELTYNVSENDAHVLLDALADESRPYELDYVINEAETMLYVVNYTDANGWKLLSTDKRTQPVLAYGQSGTFILDSLNPGEELWLEEVYDLLGELQGGGTAPGTEDEFIDEADPSWIDLAPATRSYNAQDSGEWIKVDQTTYKKVQQVGPLTKTLWHQRHPWNAKVPFSSHNYNTRCLAGCVAIAGAQMLYYLHYLWGVPAAMYERGELYGVKNSYAYSFENPIPEVWDRMPTYYDENNTYNDNFNTKYAAILIAYVGTMVDMDYAGDSSNARTEDLGKVFNGLGIKTEYSDFKTRYVLPNLDKGIPTLVRARSSTGDKEGHAWVLDGYKQDYREIVTTYRWYTYSTTNPGNPNPGDLGDGLPVTPENPDTETTTETEHAIEEPDTEISTAGDGLESVDSLNWPPKFLRSYRPKYATNRTYTTTSTISDGYFWHMNWGWGTGWNNWYATLGKWKVGGGDTYNKRREMLLITGHK